MIAFISLVLIIVTTVKSSTNLQQSKASSRHDTFGEIARHLIRTSPSDFENVVVNDIIYALSKLSDGQSALKSMDGAAHQLYNKFKDTSSLSARYQKFIDGDQSSAKEATKILEYVKTVENSLQACEILQSNLESDETRSSYLADAGLIEISRHNLTSNRVRCLLTVLRPINSALAVISTNTSDRTTCASNNKLRRYHPDELVIVISEQSSLSTLLRALEEEPESVRLQSSGFVEEDVSVQRTLFALATEALVYLAEHLLPAKKAADEVLISKGENLDNGCDESSQTRKNREKRKVKKRKTTSTTLKYVTSNRKSSRDFPSHMVYRTQSPPSTHDAHTSTRETPEPTSTAPAAQVSALGAPLPSRVRIVGHSAGAGVGAMMCGLLDGSLNVTHPESVLPFLGLYKPGHVKALCLGSPPCLSRAVVLRHVTTVICGDDLVARSSPSALRDLRARVLLSPHVRRKRTPSLLDWMPGRGLLTDAISVAGKGVRQYAAGSHDLVSLSVPGRVFFVKPRQLKDGASLQRVMRGNWREDLLWTLHDVLLSERMLEHHSLDAYIRSLARC